MIDPILVGLGILVAIVVYQQFVIRNMWYDIDDIITTVVHKINNYMITIFMFILTSVFKKCYSFV